MMMRYNETDYWNDRANKMYMYRREKFYTITPIPYYYKRREVIVKLLAEYIMNNRAKSVCDYGCGDGEYIRLLADFITHRRSGEQNIEWGGVDLSREMIRQAKRACQFVDHVEFGISATGILSNRLYDVIYSVAVFAHIDDLHVENLFEGFKNNLSGNGKLIICEQVGTRRVEGETYTRRTIDEYKKILQKAGFVIEEIKLIDFWAHRIFFERKLAKCFYKKIDASTYHDKQIEANRRTGFKICSSIFTILSKPYLFKKDMGWGYAFIIAKKETN